MAHLALVVLTFFIAMGGIEHQVSGPRQGLAPFVEYLFVAGCELSVFGSADLRSCLAYEFAGWV